MKTLMFAAVLSVSIFGAITSAAATEAGQNQATEDREIYCTDLPGKGYKCSDGSTEADTHKAVSAGEGLARLTMTARVEMTVCDNQPFMRMGGCTRKPYPDTDVLFVPQDKCVDIGRQLAFSKHWELNDQGWKATLVWRCDQ
ncbi:hypothetical protein O9X98_14685 [Agrobacterium salinitolerans]|nr:hypothetical protein [Agrobacterium salinitolerans]